MNGEFNELFGKIQEWSKQVHEQRHNENLDKFEKIFNRLNELPCKGNSVWIKVLTVSNGAVWVVIAFLIKLNIL